MVQENKFELKKGCTLTLNCEIMSETGRIIFNPGDKVKVEKVNIKEGFWGRGSGQWYPDEITGVNLKKHRGDWSLSIFEETKLK